MARLDALAAFTDVPGQADGLYLSPPPAAASIRAWWKRPAWGRDRSGGNVRARYEGQRAGLPALTIGSHIDTVRDAGRYDGNLGALAALAWSRSSPRSGERLDIAIEIVAFGDEEGVRFPDHPDRLARARRDRAERPRPEGRRRRHAARGLNAFGGDPDRPPRRAPKTSRLSSSRISSRARCWRPRACARRGHRDQRRDAARGIVEGSRATPARRRWGSGRDALAAAAEMCWRSRRARGAKPDWSPPLAARSLARRGQCHSRPGAVFRSTFARRSTSPAAAPSPTSPRRCRRSPASRRQARTDADPRGGGYVCDPTIVAGLRGGGRRGRRRAARCSRGRPRHDGHGPRWPAGMLFVRCKGGVSHNPAESIGEDDCAIALAALARFAEDFRPA